MNLQFNAGLNRAHPRSDLSALLLSIMCFCTFFLTSTWPEPGHADQVFEHKWGITTVPDEPKRIVSLSYNGADFFLALGKKPVGIRQWFGGNEFGLWPWAEDLRGDYRPTLIGQAINIEEIAALQPDLIEAIWADLSEDEYQLLSRFAPVVVQKKETGPYETTWQEMLLIIGHMTGKADTAARIVAQTDARLAEIRQTNPQWQGMTAAIGMIEGPVLFNASDTRWRLLRNLGFKLHPDVKAAMSPGFYTRISAESVAPFKADLLVWLNTQPDSAKLDLLPLRKTTRAYREGREVFLPTDLSAALSYSSPLSIEYALEKLPPLLRAAVDGDPETKASDTF